MCYMGNIATLSHSYSIGEHLVPQDQLGMRTSPLHAAMTAIAILRCQILLSLFGTDVHDANIVTPLCLQIIFVNL